MNECCVSFIIPTYNSDRTIEACLRSIRNQDTSSANTSLTVEIIVVDNHSTDRTPVLAHGIADIFVSQGPERSAQRNYGARLASGSVLIFIDSDMVLTARVAIDALRLMAVTHTAAAVIPEFSFGNGYFAQCRALEKRLYLGAERVEAARIFRRSEFERFGGYDEGLTGPEDWELPDQMRASGQSIGRIRAAVLHDEGRVSLRSTFSKKRYYGRSLPQYLGREAGTSKSRVHRRIPISNLRWLLVDPLHLPGLALLKAVDAGGLAVGMRDGQTLAE